MSMPKGRDAKAINRLKKHLKKMTYEYNKPRLRMIDGQYFPYQAPYRNFLKDWENGLILVSIIKKNEYEIKDLTGAKVEQ